MKATKQMIILICIVGVAICGYQCWSKRFPSRPKSTHDPMHAGYPDTPDKPELVKQAEQLTVKNWDYVQEILPQVTSEEHFTSFMRELEEHNTVFRSDGEKEEYWKCQVAAKVIYVVVRYAQTERQISNAKEIQAAYWEYVFDEYLKKKRGIRTYNLRNPKDKKILEEGGMNFK